MIDLIKILSGQKNEEKEEAENIARIIDWGHRSVHQSQVIPFSLAYYCFWYLDKKLFEVINRNKPDKKHYDKLLKEGKIKTYDVDHMFPNLYHIRPL